MIDEFQQRVHNNLKKVKPSFKFRDNVLDALTVLRFMSQKTDLNIKDMDDDNLNFLCVVVNRAIETMDGKNES